MGGGGLKATRTPIFFGQIARNSEKNIYGVEIFCDSGSLKDIYAFKFYNYNLVLVGGGGQWT